MDIHANVSQFFASLILAHLPVNKERTIFWDNLATLLGFDLRCFLFLFLILIFYFTFFSVDFNCVCMSFGMIHVYCLTQCCVYTCILWRMLSIGKLIAYISYITSQLLMSMLVKHEYIILKARCIDGGNCCDLWLLWFLI